MDWTGFWRFTSRRNRITPNRASTTAISTIAKNTTSADSHTGHHDDRPAMAQAPRAGTDQNSTKSAATIHSAPQPPSFAVRASHALAASTSAMTSARTSSGISPRRVSRLSSARSRKPRGVDISGPAARFDRDLAVVDGVLHGLLEVSLGLLAGLQRCVETLPGGALGGGGLGDLHRGIPHGAGQCRGARLGEVLHLVDLALHRRGAPQLVGLGLDLLVPLTAGACAEDVARGQSDDESYLAPHGVSSRSVEMLVDSRVAMYARVGILG